MMEVSLYLKLKLYPQNNAMDDITADVNCGAKGSFIILITN